MSGPRRSVESVERSVYDFASLSLTSARTFDRLCYVHGHPVGYGSRKLGLQLGRRSEVVKQIGVRASDLCRYGLQCNRLRPLVQEEQASRLQCRGPAFFRVQSSASY